MNKNRPRILYFTFITPSEKFGGGIAVIQSLYSLCNVADVVYIGPEYNKQEFEMYDIKPSATYIIEKIENKRNRAWNFLTKGITTSFYVSWKKIIDKVNASRFDCCYMDFTRQDFVVKWANKHNLPIILRAHNVEADYFESMYKMNKSVSAFIHKRIGRNAERKCIKNANKILALTNRDKSRFEELYGIKDEVIELFPICVKHFTEEEKAELPEPFISITGSLWFGPNADGIIWFLENVWRKIDRRISDKYALVIAGANPNRRICTLAKELNNVHLFPNPKNIGAFYKQALIYIAPIFYGAGMKVKIAEALSCGLPVVTTNHAFAGYENMAEMISISDDAECFRNSIEELLKKDRAEIMELKEKIKNEFERNYSLSESCRMMKKYIKSVL